MANDLETMYKTQMQANLNYLLDSATQAGDIAAARKAAQQIAEFAIQTSKTSGAPQFTDADLRAALKAKAPWFGVDPRRSAKAVEFGKNMEPASFKTPEEFADELIKAIKQEFEPDQEPDEDDEEDEEEKEEEKKPARKKTDAPTGNMARAVPRKSSGPWAKLSDAPKEIAETIRASADKFTRNATKEQRDKYIATALGTAYAADQRAKGKK
jgi:hypothetical protein